MKFKFSINERVNVVASNIIAVIDQIEYKVITTANKENITTRYGIYKEGYSFLTWHNEWELESLDNFDPEYLVDINKVLIDVNLMTGNYEAVKKFNDEINKLIEGEQCG